MRANVPTYFMRYEDLCTKPVEILKELFCFILNVKSVDGTVIEKRIIDFIESNKTKKSSVYKLKKDQDYTKLLRNEKLYTPELLEHLKTELKDAMCFFGYSNSPESDDQNTETSFFNYDRDSFTPQQKEYYQEFRKHNEKIL